MANIFEKKERHVIPNWRSFDNTVKLWELNGASDLTINTTYKPDISDLTDDWEHTKNIGIAGDILGVAITCNQQDNIVVKEIAKYILDNKGATSALINAANSIINNANDKDDNVSFEIANTDSFLDKTTLITIYSKIRFLKQKLRDNPSNPIAWVDLARLYSINGQEKQAEQAMKNALFLAPENRFVLRTMARFFIHLGDIDFAHENIRKKNIIKHDPWLIATEIATADLRGRHSVFTKKGIDIINSKSFHPFNISELSSAIATIEMYNGNNKKSKILFQESLICPNDNSLAQAEWASQEDSSLLDHLDPTRSQSNVVSFEALAMDSAEHEEWENALVHSKNWFLDLPFSKGSVLFGHQIATNKLKDQKEAVAIAKLGLLSHPNDPQLLNNIAYSLCLDDDVLEAEKYLRLVKANDISKYDINNVCLTATNGLLKFRKKDIEGGRKDYVAAIELAKELQNDYLVSLAFVNLAREEIRINSLDRDEYIDGLEEVINKSTHRDLKEMAKDVIYSSRQSE